jgi:hypothetical protein
MEQDKDLEIINERAEDLNQEALDVLDYQVLDRIEQLWIAEAKRRRDEVRSGEVKTIPGPEALRKVRDALKR